MFWWQQKNTEVAVASTSKQWTTAQNGFGNLTLEEADVTKPKDGEVLVKIHAVSLNFRDTEGWLRRVLQRIGSVIDSMLTRFV